MLAIKNFGMFWERRLIFWGGKGGGNKGQLLGYRKKIESADFREQIGVYLLYDSHKEVVYIGQAGKGGSNLFNRLRQHTVDHLWNRWEYFSWFGMCKVNANGTLSMADKPDRKVGGSIADALNEIESILIHVFEPKLNRQGGKWAKTEEFYQLRHEQVLSCSLEELYEQQKEILNKLNTTNK